jgi:hypothetical protein
MSLIAHIDLAMSEICAYLTGWELTYGAECERKIEDCHIGQELDVLTKDPGLACFFYAREGEKLCVVSSLVEREGGGN